MNTIVSAANPTGPGAVVATDTRDAMDRVTLYQEFANGNTTATFSRADTFNNDNLVTAETDHDVQNGTDNMSVITNTYAPGNLLTSSSAASYSNNSYQLTTTTTNTYAYWDTAVQAKITTSNSNGTGTTTFAYDQNGYITSAVITGGNSQSVSYNNDAMGHILTRTVTLTSSTVRPIQAYYYLGGVQIGDNGDNGPSSTDYAIAIHQHTLTNGSGLFQNGGTTASSSANFAQTYNAIDPTSADNAGTSSGYTVKSGDTLQAIAQAVWGDSSLWYVIAQANGLSASSNLSAGEILSIPAKVMSLHNSASTSRVYNQTQAIGDVSPTTPPPPSNSSDCGILGEIISAILVVVGTIVGTMILPGIGTIIGASLGDAAGQGVNIALGNQKSFSFGEVVETALMTALMPGSTGDPLTDFVTHAVADAEIQGIEVATGLENHFDWAGVAVAGVEGGLGDITSKVLTSVGISGPSGSFGAIANQALTGVINTAIGAGTRSVLTNTSFDANFESGLASLVGNTIGNVVGNAIVNAIQGPSSQPNTNASTSISGTSNGSGGSDLAIGTGVAPGTTIGGSTLANDTTDTQTAAGATVGSGATGGAADGIIVTNGGLSAQDYAQLSASANVALGIAPLPSVEAVMQAADIISASNAQSAGTSVSGTSNQVIGYAANGMNTGSDTSQPSGIEINPGDTLTSIAAAHNITVDALLAANSSITDPNLIIAGNAIRLPAGATQIESDTIMVTAKAVAAPSSGPPLGGYAPLVYADGALLNSGMFQNVGRGQKPLGLRYAPISPAEATAAANGDRLAFWTSRLNRGDPLAATAISIVTNSNEFGQYANMRLRGAIFDENLSTGQPIDPESISNEVQQIGVQLMQAHENAVITYGNPTADQIEAYHAEVFSEHGLPATTFGGAMLTGTGAEATITSHIFGWLTY